MEVLLQKFEPTLQLLLLQLELPSTESNQGQRAFDSVNTSASQVIWRYQGAQISHLLTYHAFCCLIRVSIDLVAQISVEENLCKMLVASWTGAPRAPAPSKGEATVGDVPQLQALSKAAWLPWKRVLSRPQRPYLSTLLRERYSIIERFSCTNHWLYLIFISNFT